VTREQFRQRIEELLVSACLSGMEALICPDEEDDYMADLVEHAMRLLDDWENGKEQEAV